MSRTFGRLFASALLLLTAGAANAGVPFAVLTPSASPLTLSSPGLHQPVTQTFTVSATVSPGSGALLGEMNLTGNNATDFAIVGGTCGTTTTLTTDTPTCTVIVQYTPSTTGPEGVADLNISCTTVGLIGGVSVVCDGGQHTLNFFNGLIAAVAAVAQLPTLNPRLLTLLALLIMGAGIYFSTRKSKSTP